MEQEMIVAIIQARTGSTRLPNKVLADIEGKSMLAHIIERVKASSVDKVIVATTTNPQDEPIVDIAKQYGVDYFLGSEHDVLDRYYNAATRFRADSIVRITADCPLIDPHVIDKIVQAYLKGNYDYVTNVIKRTYPDGLDTEVFSYSALQKAWLEATLPEDREHVTLYVWKRPDLFNHYSVEQDKDLSRLRWTVDTQKDLDFVRDVYKCLGRRGIFYMEDILLGCGREDCLL